MWITFVKKDKSGQSRSVAKESPLCYYQILGRRAIRPEHRVMLDNFYEKHASLGLDLAIILATIPAIFSRRGAK